MSLPKQVQAQVDEAERLEALLQQQTEAPVDPPKTEDVSEQPEQPGDPAPPPPTPVETVPEETWQRRYKTLQGKFNAEVPRLSAQVQELTRQLADTQSKMADMAKRPEAKAPAKSLVTDKDIEAFGGDLVDLVKRQAQETAEQLAEERLSKLAEENDNLRTHLTGVAERQVSNDRDMYFAKLAAQVPDYEELNVDEGFLAWLEEADPLSGQARQEYLNTAFKGFDALRTAQLFNAYKATLAPSPASQAKAPSRNLQRQVTPSTSKVTGPTEPQPDTRIWKQSEITSFYADVTKGLYKGNAAEQAKIEAEIDRAVAEGRVA